MVDGAGAFLALSGDDGSMLWNHAADADGPGGPRPEGPELPGPLNPASRPATVIEPPTVGDLDGDGTPDLIVALAFQESPSEYRAGLAASRRICMSWNPGTSSRRSRVGPAGASGAVPSAP